MTEKRDPRPCSLEVTIAATDDHGVAVVQWADGEYTVKLDSGAYVDVAPSQLVFIGKAAA